MRLGISIFSLLALSFLVVAGFNSRRPGPGALFAEKSLDPNQLQYFPTSNPNGLNTGILIAPGGGYSHISQVGDEASTYFNSKGYDAWVLTYTVTMDTGGDPVYPHPINQALEAVRQIRSRNLVDKLGIIGFSAGGHLAAITVTNKNVDLDFAILGYPVITMEQPWVHSNSRLHLIGPNPTPELVRTMSAEQQVTADTPPVFLMHTKDDPIVSWRNTNLFATAMKDKGRPVQTYIEPHGPHGLGLAIGDAEHDWTPQLELWMNKTI